MATFIISVALLVVGELFITSTKVNLHAAEYTAASNMAQKQLEVLKGTRTAAAWANQNTTPLDNLIPWQVTSPPAEQLVYTTTKITRVINGVNMTFSDQLTCNEVDYLIHTEAVMAPENSNLVQVTVTVSWLDHRQQTQFVQTTTFYSIT